MDAVLWLGEGMNEAGVCHGVMEFRCMHGDQNIVVRLERPSGGGSRNRMANRGFILYSRYWNKTIVKRISINSLASEKGVAPAADVYKTKAA